MEDKKIDFNKEIDEQYIYNESIKNADGTVDFSKDFGDFDNIEVKEDVSLVLKKLYHEENSAFEKKDELFVLDIDKLSKSEKDVYNEFILSPKSFINKCKAIQVIEFGDKYNKLNIINFNGTNEQIANFRVKHLNNVFKIKGMISKTNKTIALVNSTTYECLHCGMTVKIPGGGGDPSCSCGNSNKKKFSFIDHDLEDVQEIEIEENQDDLEDRQPQKIRVRLLGDLTDSEMTGNLQPGTKTEIIGVVEEIAIEKKRANEDLFEYRLHCLDATNLDTKNDKESISEEDIVKIKEIAKNKDILKIMSRSLAPEVIGMDKLKESVVLQQFGGVKKKMADGKFTRDRIHILCVGDAGMAKTQIAKNVVLRTPRGYYTSGEQTTAVGLTAAVEKDEMTGAYGLKAGAMCKANGSILTVDEIDKAGEGALKALHTPLESGLIPISKAGINTTLKAECSLLALANPKGGRFEDGTNKTLVQQIDFPPTLLSRFDMVIVVRDELNAKVDGDIIDLICSAEVVEGEEIERKELIVPVDLYRKYVTYAKELRPTLDKPLIIELKKFYNKVKSRSFDQNSKIKGMPITIRHVQGIIRMSEAHAKLRLSPIVELQDFNIAKNLFWESLLVLGVDEEGNIDMARVEGGETSADKKVKSELIEAMRNVQDSTGHPVSFSTLKALMGFKEVSQKTLSSLEEGGRINKTPFGWEVL